MLQFYKEGLRFPATYSSIVYVVYFFHRISRTPHAHNPVFSLLRRDDHRQYELYFDAPAINTVSVGTFTITFAAQLGTGGIAENWKVEMLDFANTWVVLGTLAGGMSLIFINYCVVCCRSCCLFCPRRRRACRSTA